MDFGIATAQSSISKEKKHDYVEGSSSYLSQEQILGKGADERTDIYAVGVLLMEMFSGKRPFYGANEEEIMLKQVQEEPTPISHHWSDSPIELENLILKCLSKNPNNRPQSVQTVLNELLKINFS
jgi:serine/threonine-protein kinase